MTTVTIVGNVGDTQLKFTPAGKAVLEFSLAENHSKKNQQGGWDEDGTTWRRVTIWEAKAEALGNVLSKGDRVIVTGTERLREYDRKDGGKGQSLEVNAQWIGIVPKSQQQGNQQQQSAPAANSWNAPAEDPWSSN